MSYQEFPRFPPVRDALSPRQYLPRCPSSFRTVCPYVKEIRPRHSYGPLAIGGQDNIGHHSTCTGRAYRYLFHTGCIGYPSHHPLAGLNWNETRGLIICSVNSMIRDPSTNSSTEAGTRNRVCGIVLREANHLSSLPTTRLLLIVYTARPTTRSHYVPLPPTWWSVHANRLALRGPQSPGSKLIPEIQTQLPVRRSHQMLTLRPTGLDRRSRARS